MAGMPSATVWQWSRNQVASRVAYLLGDLR